MVVQEIGNFVGALFDNALVPYTPTFYATKTFGVGLSGRYSITPLRDYHACPHSTEAYKRDDENLATKSVSVVRRFIADEFAYRLAHIRDEPPDYK